MTVEHKNINIHYIDQGTGPTLVLLHGFLENLTMWDKLIPHLIKTHRVIAIDLLGHGKTDCIGYVHTMEDMADAVFTVLNTLKIESSIFIGHSMGGYVSLAYAEKYPKKIKGLCLANSTAGEDSEERKTNRNRAIQAVKHNYKAFVGMAVANLFSIKNQDKLKTQIESVKNQALKTPVQGIIAALEGMKIRFNRFSVLKNGHFKKLMIIGIEDPIMSRDLLIEEAKTTHTTYVEITGGHMSYIENEAFFLREIMYFIENI